jgi:hypothetical protein
LAKEMREGWRGVGDAKVACSGCFEAMTIVAFLVIKMLCRECG